MKVIVAPKDLPEHRHRSLPLNDYHFARPGELLALSEICDTERIHKTCGCSRSFTGVDSRRGTTVALVVNSKLTRAQVKKKFAASYEKAYRFKIVASRLGIIDYLLDAVNKHPVGSLLRIDGNRLVADK